MEKRPREMLWGGRWEGGSCLGTHVHPWWIHVNVWQNQYKNKKIKIKSKMEKKEEGGCELTIGRIYANQTKDEGLMHYLI